jgi:hypothetical protein
MYCGKRSQLGLDYTALVVDARLAFYHLQIEEAETHGFTPSVGHQGMLW